jgi:hypothetical protein
MVSGMRVNPTPNRPADYTVFAVYRWFAWVLAALLLLIWPSPERGMVLLTTALLNIPLTALARPLLHLFHRHPALVVLDILYSVVVIWWSGGWDSAFFLYACASLVAPALLFGWRGGVMAGLTLVTCTLLMFWLSGQPAEGLIIAGAWPTLALIMMTPPIFGGTLPAAVQRLRDMAAHLGHPHEPTQSRQSSATRSPQAPPPASGFVGRSPDLQLQYPLIAGESPLLAPTATVRAAAGVEELRRVIFAPLAADVTDLPSALHVLAMRFRQATGNDVQVVVLGRARALHGPHRDLLVRLTRESLLNVQQHAQATQVTLTLHYDATSVAVLIQDNGIGLLDGTYERPGMHALRALGYRMAEFGGRLHVFDIDGGGVTVRATMPLE